MFYGEISRRVHGYQCDILITLRENHKEDKLLGLRDDLLAFLGRNQGNSTRRDCLRYLVQFLIQINNKTMRLRIIYNMKFP
jgi:hypothetical protein